MSLVGLKLGAFVQVSSWFSALSSFNSEFSFGNITGGVEGSEQGVRINFTEDITPWTVPDNLVTITVFSEFSVD